MMEKNKTNKMRKPQFQRFDMHEQIQNFDKLLEERAAMISTAPLFSGCQNLQDYAMREMALEAIGW